MICPPAQAIVNHAFSVLKPGGDSLQQNLKIKPFSFLFCRKSCRSIGGRVQATVRERTGLDSYVPSLPSQGSSSRSLLFGSKVWPCSMQSN